MTLRRVLALALVGLLLASLLPEPVHAKNRKRRAKKRSAKVSPEPPSWLQDAVFYHVFPERFRNGDPANDPQGARPWGERPSGGSHHGGDFAGIAEKLDYLAELGVTALYLNPIHPGGSNHKYNPRDYYAVAPQFGTLEGFKKLVEQAHQKKMRVILDGVFHHTGEQFEAFQQAMQHGPSSPYWDWYKIHSFPVRTNPPNYETFGGNYGQPKLNYQNPEVRAFVSDVARFWIESCDVDGWRLDVADSIPQDFFVELRGVVKQAKKDAVLLGEIWPDAQSWLGGDQLDTVTNYPLWNTCRDVFAEGKSDLNALRDRLRQQTEIYRPQTVDALFNLLSSHDTVRFVDLCGGDRRKLTLAYTFLFTTRGAPVIYYGDEVALEGQNDPDNRRCFPWDELEARAETLTTFKRLGTLRGKLKELRRGSFDLWSADPNDGLLIYARRLGRARTIVVLNTTGQEKFAQLSAPRCGFRRGRVATDLLGQRTLRVTSSTLQIPLEPYEAVILR